MEWVDGAVYFGPQAATGQDASAAAIAALLNRHAVRRAVLISLVGLDYEAGEGNARTLATCRESGGRFLPLPVVHPLDPHLITSRLGAELRRTGFAAAGFFPARQKWPVEAWPFARLAEGISEAGLTVFVTVGGLGEPSQVCRVLTRVEGPVAIRSEAPAGYALTAEYLALGRDFPNLHFDVGNLVGSGALDVLAGELGADRLWWGSGAPFNYLGAPLALVKSAGLTEDERAWIAGRTILKLLGEEAA